MKTFSLCMEGQNGRAEGTLRSESDEQNKLILQPLLSTWSWTSHFPTWNLNVLIQVMMPFHQTRNSSNMAHCQVIDHIYILLMGLKLKNKDPFTNFMRRWHPIPKNYFYRELRVTYQKTTKVTIICYQSTKINVFLVY